MDNTFFDFVDAKIAACQAVIDSLGLDEKAESDFLQYFLSGKGIENLENIADYLKDHRLYTEENYENSCRIYEQVKIDRIHKYDGVDETLEALSKKELKLAVVTDADRENAMKRLEKTDIKKFFEIIITIEDTNKKKPEPASIELALESLGVNAEDAVMVGDSLKRDIAPAQALGMVTVYALYGDKNFFSDEPGEPDHTIDDIREIIDIIENE